MSDNVTPKMGEGKCAADSAEECGERLPRTCGIFPLVPLPLLHYSYYIVPSFFMRQLD